MASDSPRRKLLVFDGANTLFRAFFAIPALRSPDGSPTNAAYGFINTVIKMLREEQPDFAVVAYDARGPSFRQALFGDYKAGRDATPEDLKAQIPLMRELAEAHGIPVLEVSGFEADDVIATLARQAPEDVEVVIVSTDKDLMQLVSERVTLVDGMKDRRYDPAEVERRFGVPPERMLDLRALVGDPSDNIPGVKGIGEKGAAALLAEWGDLENLLAHADEVKAKRAREALVEHSDTARLSKQLATLREDVPLPEVDPEWRALEVHEPERQTLRELYRRLGFTRLLDALDVERSQAAPKDAAHIEVELRFLTRRDELEAALSDLAGMPAILGIATDGSAVDADLVALALAVDDARALFVPLGQDAIAAEDVAEVLTPRLAKGAVAGWLGAGVKHLQSLCAERGIELPPPLFDVPLAAFLIDPSGSHSVAALASGYLGISVASWEELAGRGARARSSRDLPREELARWAASQACAVRRLVEPLRKRLVSDGLDSLFEEVEMPLTGVLSRMERNGVRVDEEVLASLSREYAHELARIEKEIYELAGEEFKVNSPKQLQVILFEKLRLTPVKKTKTGFSTDEGVLEQLAAQHELPGRILAWRRLAKLVSTYIDALPPLISARTGRIHPVFHQTGAATGRLSCSNPNVQNIPIRTPEGIRIREAFVPAEGQALLSADYSQVELRILAHYSGDESLIDAFAKGEDIHRRTAAEVAGVPVDQVNAEQRARAKAVNFGIIYGSSAFGLASNLGIATGEAQETIDAYFARYKGVRRFLDETIEGARERGYVRTLLGRRRYLPDLASKNRVLRQAAERMAVNSVIQGTAADLIKRAMVDLDAALRETGSPARMILQVHDELVFEVPGSESAIRALSDLARETMEGVFELRVPLVVDVGWGASWREAH